MERDSSVLNAALGFVKFRAPDIHIFKHFRKTKKVEDALQFLAFFDDSYSRNHTPIPREWKYQYFMGAGPGLRYAIDHLSVRLD
jgi:hypothetical protein